MIVKRRKICQILATAVVSSVAVCQLWAQTPHVEKRDGRFALMVDGQPYIILGAQVNNSSAWPAMLPGVWSSLEAIHANTAEIPVYWEQIEPTPGKFNFSLVDTVVQQAREHHLHLVLLWFGTWKNGRSHYAPEWVRTDQVRFPRMQDSHQNKTDVLSPFGAATLEADKTAFAALMSHLRQSDAQHTVLMVQVENEPGAIGTDRDYSPEAQKLFESKVPAELVERLHKQSGSWEQVFGQDANEMFQAYSVAHYIDQVAKAGKQQYPLPLYVNVWLSGGDNIPGRNYPSGGAVARTLDLWKATASSIDIIAPDLYTDFSDNFQRTLAVYHRPDNATWIPETNADNACARYFFYLLADGGIGFSPFGVDRTGWILSKDAAPQFLAEDYALIGPMDREIAKLSFEGKLRSVVEEPGHPTTTVDFGTWKADVYFGMPQHGEPEARGSNDSRGRAILAQTGENEFLVAGFGVRVKFKPADPNQHAEYLHVENGHYQDGDWKTINWWNGDQTDFGLNLASSGNTVRVRLGTY